jgi:hypothetical protein
MSELLDTSRPEPHDSDTAQKNYEEFEIGHHQVPWFLWVFFSLIIVWASLSWVKFFGY